MRTVRVHRLPGWLGSRKVEHSSELHAVLDELGAGETEKAFEAYFLSLVRQGDAVDVATVAKAAYAVRQYWEERRGKSEVRTLAWAVYPLLNDVVAFAASQGPDYALTLAHRVPRLAERLMVAGVLQQGWE